MNYALLDPRFILDTVLAPPRTHVVPIPHTLDETWSGFEPVLGNFKTKFTIAKNDLATKIDALEKITEEINFIRMMIENVNSDGLKEKLVLLVDKHESEEGVSALTLQCGEAAGKVEAMRKVLMDTQAERYGKFTCFVCMDRLVDLFIEPCGHVICEPCWQRTVNHITCPGCRTETQGVKKIFNL